MGLVVTLAMVTLISMGGVALADANDGEPVWIDPDGSGELPLGWYEYCTAPSLASVQGSDWTMTEWHFVLNGWDDTELGPKPEPIYVVWHSENNQGVVELRDDFPIYKNLNQMAHYYATSTNTGIQVMEAYVFLSDDPDYLDGRHYTGNLVLSPIAAPPIPELPAVALLGIGLLGLVAFIGWKKRGIVFATSQ
jgi:hypothetical protein